MIVTTTMTCTLPPQGWAMLAPAQIPAGTAPAGYDRASDMKAIQTALESKIVRQRLKDYGLTDAEIQSRLGQLSDKQIHQLAAQVQTLSPGGDDGGGAVVGLLFIAVLVLLIIYLVKRI